MTTKTYSFLSFLLIGLLFFSCKKETPPTSISNDSPIQLQIEKVGAEYEFSWTKTNSSNFLRYEIEMSEKPIANNYVDTINPSFAQSFIIDDQNQNQLKTLLVPSTNTMYYRLFVWMGNEEYRVSNEVKFEFDNINFINKNITDFLFHNNTNTFFYTQEIQPNIDSIFSFDYKNQIFNGNVFQGSELSKGDISYNGLNAELYTPYFSSFEISVFKIPNLAHIDHIELPPSLRINKIASNNNELLAILLHNSNTFYSNVNLQVRNRLTNEILFEEEINSSALHSHISFFPNDSNKLLAITTNGKIIYEFNQSGLVNRIDAEETSSTIESVFSPDDNYFIIGSLDFPPMRLQLFDTNLELVAPIDVGPNFQDVTFSADGSKIYLIDGGVSAKVITVLSIPNLELEQTIPIPFRAEKLLINENQLLIYGKSLLSNSNKYIFSIVEI